MKKFILKLVLFLFPLIIMGVLSEILIREIPNEYRYKKKYLDLNSKNIEVLFLGNSHGFYNINPKFISFRSFNAAHVSQSLDFDFKILKKYDQKWNDLKFIVIPISYVTFFERLGTGSESWRVKNYSLYYGIKSKLQLANYSEVIGNKLSVNIDRLYSYYYQSKTNISCNDLGWGTGFKSTAQKDLYETGKDAAFRHTIDNDIIFKENCLILNSIIRYCGRQNIKVLLFTPPAFHTYYDLINKNQLNKTTSYSDYCQKNNHHVKYINLFTSHEFVESDFYDGDHLNEIGAKKLSQKINLLINLQK